MILKNKIVYCFVACLFIVSHSNALDLDIFITYINNIDTIALFTPSFVNASIGDNIIFQKNPYSTGNFQIIEGDVKGSCVKSTKSDAFTAELSDANPTATLPLAKSGTFFFFDADI
ncbi:440_t:CDS:2 [Entrophospora sp. SA101]|nr:440_t:CDS:2 [Entrophospora sp. SA101]